MADSFVGEIRPVGFNFAPVGWALCNGQLLAISQYDALFTLIGKTYGGDGVQNFALPNLQSRVPIHTGTGSSGTYPLGTSGGSETAQVTVNQLPAHTHPIALQGAAASGTQNSPANNFFSASGQKQFGSLVAPGAVPHLSCSHKGQRSRTRTSSLTCA